MTDQPRLTAVSLRNILTDVQSGDARLRECAQADLLHRCERLLSVWAWEEVRRHGNQHITLEFEEMKSVLVVNLLEAADKMDPTKVGTSGTNYLYTLVITNARREVQRNHAATPRFSSSFLEQARRAEAITARLHQDFGRPPTDEEIIAASSEPFHTTRRMGAKGDRPASKRPLTQAFLDRYRQAKVVMEVAPMPVADVFTAPGTEPASDEPVSGLEQVFVDVTVAAGAHPTAVDVLWRLYGLGDYPEPAPQVEVAEQVGVCPTVVRRIARAWQKMCRTPHGAFHQVVAGLTAEQVAACGLASTVHTLGPFDAAQAVPVPVALTADPHQGT